MEPATLLIRQVHPSWVQEGRVTSQAFQPTKKDQGLLSTYNGDLIIAEDAWRHFTITLGRPSSGVQGILCEECHALGLEARPEPESFPEHSVIDFNNFGTNEIRKKAMILRAKAAERGWLFLPSSI